MAVTNEGLNVQLMREVFAAGRTKFKKGFRETQSIRSFALQREFMRRAEKETPEHGFEWTTRVKAAQGSTQKVHAFEKLNYVRDTYDVSMKVTPAAVATHKNMMFSDLAKRINTGMTEKLWSDYKMKSSAAEETKATMWEGMLLAPGADGVDNEWLGLLYWLRRSMTSGGVFTAQPTPARNGVYFVDDNGALSYNMAGRDLRNAAFSRLRPLCATHTGTLGPVELETISVALQELNVDYLAELQGDKSTTDLAMYWDDLFHRQYEAILTALGGPRMRDYWDTGATKARGATIVQTPSLNSHFLRPIMIVNMADLKVRQEKGGWDVEYTEQLNHDSYAFPRVSRGQMWCEDPATAGCLIHGSHATGV